MNFTITSWWCVTSMISRSWWDRMIWTGRPFFYDLRNIKTSSKKMVSRTKFSWISNFVSLDGWFLIRCCIQRNGCLVSPLLNFLLLLLPFLLLLSHLVTSTNTFTKRRGRRGGRNKLGRRQTVNFRINWRLILSSWRCTWLRRNHDILNQGGWKKPYWQANGKSWKGQWAI